MTKRCGSALRVVVWVLGMGVTGGWGGGVARAAPTSDWHLGVNLRTDLGTRQVRIDAGARIGRVDLIAVLDPIGLVDASYDLDLLAALRPHRLPGWAFMSVRRRNYFGAGGRWSFSCSARA